MSVPMLVTATGRSTVFAAGVAFGVPPGAPSLWGAWGPVVSAACGGRRPRAVRGVLHTPHPARPSAHRDRPAHGPSPDSAQRRSGGRSERLPKRQGTPSRRKPPCARCAPALPPLLKRKNNRAHHRRWRRCPRSCSEPVPHRHRTARSRFRGSSVPTGRRHATRLPPRKLRTTRPGWRWGP